MYCKNCGSILQSNANFCHVCGTKVDIDDVFDATPKEEKKVEDSFNSYTNDSSYQENLNNNNNYNETNNSSNDGYYSQKEEPVFKNYFEDINTTQAPKSSKKPFIPGLFSMIVTAYIAIQCLSMWAINILYNNYLVDNAGQTFDQYYENVGTDITRIIIYLVLGVVAGGVLGGIGLKVAQSANSKLGKAFSFVGITLATLELCAAVLLFVLRANII